MNLLCHIERSLATKTNLHYVVSTSRFDLQKYNHPVKPSKKICPLLYSTDFDSFDNPIELSHPFNNCKIPVGVTGSCRGLLLLRVDDGYLLLYNPTTQTYNELLFLPVSISDQSCARYVFGFGNDSVFRGWKCVRIMQLLNTETGVVQCEVMAYSLNCNYWKTLVDVPRFSKPWNWGIGALVNDVMQSFQVKTDDYLYMGDLDGCLCLLANCYLECNVWIMKEYGVAESWTRMFRYEKHRWESLTRPVSLSMEKEKLFVLTSLQKLSYIDLQTMELTDVMITNCDSSLGANVYVENILKLNCPEDIRITKKPGKGKNKKKNRRSNY